MANNLILANGETLIDLTGDTVDPERLFAGATAHNSAGVLIQGTAVMPVPDGITLTTDASNVWSANYSNENLLDNPDFRINQRHITNWVSAAGSSVYGVDRWCTWGSGSGAVVNTDGDGNVVSLTVRQYIQQELAHDIKANTEYTLSGVINDEYFSVTFAAAAGNPEAAFPTGGSATLYKSQKLLRVWVPANGELTIKWLKLEEGAKATPFIPPDPLFETMKCQQYYKEIVGVYQCTHYESKTLSFAVPVSDLNKFQHAYFKATPSPSNSYVVNIVNGSSLQTVTNFSCALQQNTKRAHVSVVSSSDISDPKSWTLVIRDLNPLVLTS